MRCRACHSDALQPMIDLGRQPIAHRMPATVDTAEALFPFALHLCITCGLAQIVDPIPPAVLYQDFNYCFSGWKPQPHIADEIDRILAARPVGQSFEIGANDGLFLKALAERGVARPIGLEPNRVAGQIARDAGFMVYQDLLSDDLARRVVVEQGRMDMVCARQVLEHLDDIDGFFRAVDILLKPDGVLFIDVPDFAGGLRTGDLSVLWEEHVSYFTAPVLTALLARHGFIVTDAAHYDFSGGTIAVIARRARAVSVATETAGHETSLGTHGDSDFPRFKDRGKRSSDFPRFKDRGKRSSDFPRFKDRGKRSSHLGRTTASSVAADPIVLGRSQLFATRVHDYGNRLRALLADCRGEGRQILLYGVGCRACTTVNGLRLGKLIDAAIDDQVERQGLFMPGSKLPILGPEVLVGDNRPRLVLLAVNNENEEKVRARLSGLLGNEPPTLSLQSPNDISALLTGMVASRAA